MSHIDDLIRDLCPDGVEYKPLGEILNYEQPGPYLVSSKEYNLSYPTPVLTAGATFILGHTNEQHGIYSASQDSPAIIFDDFTTASKWVDFPFKAKSSAMKILTSSSGDPVDLRYTYYVLEALNYTPSTHSRHWISIFSNMPIAFPPRKVREYIVSTLNRFKALEAELEVELEARRQQYFHYCTSAFDSATNVEWTTLERVSLKISSGGTPSSSNSAYYGGNIPWVRSQDVNFNMISSTSATISDIGLKNSAAKWIPSNSLIIAMYGASAARAAINTIPVTTNQACCNLQLDATKVTPRYAYHWIYSQYNKLRSLGEGSQSNLNSRKIKNYPIPVPSLNEQRRITDALDQFHSLVNDLTSGLPAEIKARRKQYEYYRDSLLTFPEKK